MKMPGLRNIIGKQAAFCHLKLVIAAILGRLLYPKFAIAFESNMVYSKTVATATKTLMGCGWLSSHRAP